MTRNETTIKNNVYKKLNMFVNNNQLKDLLEEYLNELFAGVYFKNLANKAYCASMLNRMIKMFETISSKELSWKLLCKQVQEADDIVKGWIIKFYQFVTEKGYLSGEYSDYLCDNLWVFDAGKGSPISKVFFEGGNPLNILDLPNNRYKKSRFNLNTDSPF